MRPPAPAERLRRAAGPAVARHCAARGPREGWTGILAGAADGSVLSLVFNDATYSDWHGAVGWSEMCPTPQS
ncbi:hypothetical protein GCM10009661_27440 [Catellatospora chokoriensis]|uniref:Uncharacterized protein n=1 Tax=Catellatospora chokoriensis TaxID=310353 RepID=A0A8J3NT26_9ACTN|nr:hypothetical protein Cch02nite_46270 [Catellatospora chokoriensis]